MSQSIGERIKIARKKANILQEDAAQAMEMSRPTLSAIESDKRIVTAEDIIRFAELYQVSATELLYGFKEETDEAEFGSQKQRLFAYLSGFAKLNEANQSKVLEYIKNLQ